MGVQADWDDKDKRIIRWVFDGRWTWGELDETLNCVQTTMLPLIDYGVDYLIDVRTMSILPPDVVTRVKANYLSDPDKLRLLLIVGADANIQLLWNTFTKLPYARHLAARFFETLDQARAFSRAFRPEG